MMSRLATLPPTGRGGLGKSGNTSNKSTSFAALGSRRADRGFGGLAAGRGTGGTEACCAGTVPGATSGGTVPGGTFAGGRGGGTMPTRRGTGVRLISGPNHSKKR